MKQVFCLFYNTPTDPSLFLIRNIELYIYMLPIFKSYETTESARTAVK